MGRVRHDGGGLQIVFVALPSPPCGKPEEYTILPTQIFARSITSFGLNAVFMLN